MTQQDVLKILKKNPDKWFSSKEIAKIICVGVGSISTNLTKLYNSGDVLRKDNGMKRCIWQSKQGRPYFWRFKE